MQLKFKILTLRQIVPQIRSEDWFVTIDLKNEPFRLQGIRIMNYIDNWLILAQSHQLTIQHRDVVLGVGVTAKHHKERAFSTTEDHFSWTKWTTICYYFCRSLDVILWLLIDI